MNVFIFSQTPFVPKNNNSGSLASKLSTYRNSLQKTSKEKCIYWMIVVEIQNLPDSLISGLINTQTLKDFEI